MNRSIDLGQQSSVMRLQLPLPSGMRAVVFDVDGTLYDQRRLQRAMAIRLVAWVVAHPGKGLRVVQLIRRYRSAQEELRGCEHALPHECQGLDDAQLRVAADAVGVDVPLARSIVHEWMFRRPLAPMRKCGRRGAPGVLKRLQELGLRLGVYSDYPSEHKLEALGVRHFFNVIVSSSDKEVGSFKPDPTGFLVAAERLGVAPEEALYVGDRPDVDARGARAAGMPAVILAPRRRPGQHHDHLVISDIRSLVERR